MSGVYTNHTCPITQPEGVLPPVGKMFNYLIHKQMETNKNLEFLETFTVEQFKAEKRVDKVRVKENPNTGKLFFTFGAKTGAVAAKGVPTHPMISLVKGSDNEQFYLLHEEGQGNAPVVAEF